MAKDKLLDTINDVFVISTSGIPYFATCFGGETCKKNPDHLLLSGFIAALFQFSKEFGQESIRDVAFDDAKMVFEKRNIGKRELLIVFFTTIKPKTKDVRKVVVAASDLFIKEFKNKIIETNDFVSPDDYKDFSKMLLNLKLINRSPAGKVPVLEKKSFYERILKAFN